MSEEQKIELCCEEFQEILGSVPPCNRFGYHCSDIISKESRRNFKTSKLQYLYHFLV